jgi:thiamine-phosphate pyrophosphorylase
MNAPLELTTYLITDRTLCGARGVSAVVQAAISGGVSIVQLRDPDAKTGSLVEQARALVRLLRPAGIPLIVNDRVDVALAADADGVHIGQLDMPVADARALLGRDKILGLSISSLAELERARLDGVDYLGVGPIFATRTKPDAAAPMGLPKLTAIAARTRLPIAAIGGIHQANAAQTVEAGAAGVAVVSAICAADDPAAATRELVRCVRKALQARSELPTEEPAH